MSLENRVCINSCEEYDSRRIYAVIQEQFRQLNAAELVKPGMKAVIKPNLVLKSKPEAAVVTHPLVVAAVASCLQELGAEVLVAESPGGLYTPGALRASYHACGYSDAAKSYGFALNEDCSSRELKTPGGAVSKTFEVIAPILDADLIVDVCKLKTHCMMGLSAAVKNMFGVVPGLMKPELHCRFPEKAPFAEMLVDLCCGVRPHLCVVDAITAMEGNGPSGGNPRFVGALLSARDPFYLDFLCAGLVGMKTADIPYLQAAHNRGLCPADIDGLEIIGENYRSFIAPDFVQPESKTSNFIEHLPRFLQPLAARLATPAPRIRAKDCVGCGKCAESCPQHTIKLENRRARIDYSHCIRCYCCHEMCPQHVIDIKRMPLFKL